MAVTEPYYVVETTIHPGVQYNVSREEMEALSELGILLGEPVQQIGVLDSQFADLVTDVNSTVHQAIVNLDPKAHVHPSTDISDSGTFGRTLLATSAALAARTALGLDQVSNTSDANKPISTAEQTALNLKAPLASPAFTGTPTGITKAHVGLGSVDNTADTAKPVSTAQQTALNLKANAANPVFTGTVTIPDNALAIADTSGLQTALDAKAPTANPVFTGTVTIPDNALAIADTSGLQTALDAKVPLSANEGFKWHDGTAGGGTRPTGHVRVRWANPVGTAYARPTNMVSGDVWEHD